MDPELFVRVQAALKPDWFVAPGDADTCSTSSKKRTKKAVDNTLAFLDTVLAARDKSEVKLSSKLDFNKVLFVLNS